MTTLDVPVTQSGSIVRYSIFSVVSHALRGNTGWKPVWREAEPKPAYDVVIVGGGGHGLATAYYLAKEHGIRNVAVLEKGWIGCGNVGRNTTIIRSNYLLPGNIPFYEWSMKLWEGLEQDFNYNAMVSQRGVLNLFHSDAQRDAYARRGNAMRLNGVDAELLDREQVRAIVPFLDFDNARFPDPGRPLQRRGGTARHDAVAWGYARAADQRGVDIVQNCEVTGIRIEGGRVIGVDTAKGFVRAGKVGLACAGNSSRVAALAGLRLPIESHVLQAFVSEGVKPLIDTVITFGAGHFYISQSDKGGLVFGGDIDGYNSYAQRGNLPTVEDVCEGGMALMPMIGRLRMLRSWGGLMDMSMDGSPIIDKTPVDGPLPQCRLVLRRLQGDAGLGLVLCPHHRPRRAARVQRGLSARPLRYRPSDRREGRGRPTQPALKARHADRLLPLRARGNEEFAYLGDATVQRPPADPALPLDDAARQQWVDYVYLRDNPAGRIASCGSTSRAAGPGWWSRAMSARTPSSRWSPRATSRWRGARPADQDPVRHPASRTHSPLSAWHASGVHRRHGIDRSRRSRSPSTAAPTAAIPATRWRRRCWRTGCTWSAGRSSITGRAASSPPARRSPMRWSSCAQGARREPNTRATTAELYDGLVAASQNRWPSLRFDLLAINSVLAPILSAGFYYKTFMWPASFWEKVYEPLIRRAAGLGRAAGRRRSGHLREGVPALRRAGRRRRCRGADGRAGGRDGPARASCCARRTSASAAG